MYSKSFRGIFKEEFERFIMYKQSLGYYKNIEDKKIYELITLNNYLDSYNLQEIKITKDMYDDYISNLSGLSQSTIHHHECTLRQFSKFLKNEGYKDIYISYDCKVKMPRDYIPYVFSNEEIYRIFDVIDNLEFKKKAKTSIFYQTVFRLLYCTGLRLGEATNLKIEDVDLNNNLLYIYSGKGNVSRIVPFKPSLGVWLSYYRDNFYKKGDKYFFESPQGGKRSNHSISDLFREKILPLAKITTIYQPGHKRGACVHSLRHTFACNSLDQMIKEGKDPYCALPYLSVYLGHTSIVNTEIYLRLTLQRHNEILNAGHFIYENSLGEYNE